nr:hypothetical protein [Tanacetum cinerariifolium]
MDLSYDHDDDIHDSVTRISKLDITLEGKNKIGFIDGYCKRSNTDERNNQNLNAGPSRPNNVNNKRQGGGSGLNNNRPSGGSSLVHENYGFIGHTIDRCFKITGYPADFGKKKCGQNFNKKGDDIGKGGGIPDEGASDLVGESMKGGGNGGE